MFFSKNLRNEDTLRPSQELGIEKTYDLGMYLGAPLLHQKVTKNSISFILDKLGRRKIFLFQVKLLWLNLVFIVCRVTLCKLWQFLPLHVRKQRLYVEILLGGVMIPIENAT